MNREMWQIYSRQRQRFCQRSPDCSLKDHSVQWDRHWTTVQTVSMFLVLTLPWRWRCGWPSRPWSAGLVWTTAPPWGWRVPGRWPLHNSLVPNADARPGSLCTPLAPSPSGPPRNPTSSAGCSGGKSECTFNDLPINVQRLFMGKWANHRQGNIYTK